MTRPMNRIADSSPASLGAGSTGGGAKPPSARDEWARHWPVVMAGTAGVALASLPSYSIGIMVQPLEEEFGWSRGAISSGPLIPAAAAVLLGPVIGLIVDRVGPRRVALAGAVLAPLSIVLLSTTISLWTWWLLWVFVALAAMFVKPMVWTAGVSSLFFAGRGLALAVTLCGIAVSSSLTPLLTSYLLASYGWRGAYIGLGLCWGAVALPLIFLFFKAAGDIKRARGKAVQSAKPAPALEPGEGVRSVRFRKLALAGTAMTLANVAIIFNLVPILISFGHSRTTAASVAGLVGISTICGRLLGGYLLDRMNGNVVAAVTTLAPAVSSLLLLAFTDSVPMVIVAALILGASLGAEIDAVAFLVTRHFSLSRFGVVFGTIGGLMALATGVGPWLANLIYDWQGSYIVALGLVVPTSVLGAVLFLRLGAYPDLDQHRQKEAA